MTPYQAEDPLQDLPDLPQHLEKRSFGYTRRGADILRHALRVKKAGNMNRMLGHALRIKKGGGAPDNFLYRQHALRIKKDEDGMAFVPNDDTQFMKRAISRAHILRAI